MEEKIISSSINLQPIQNQLDWISWSVIFGCLLLILIANIKNRSYIINLFQFKTNTNLIQSSLDGLTSIVLFLNYILIISLTLWKFFDLQKIGPNSIWFFFSILLSILGLIISKFIVIYWIELLFGQKNKFHIKYHIAFSQITGLILLPIYLLTFNLSPESHSIFIIISFSIVVFIMIFRELKSLFTALQNRISFFYIILYLCTLEILPLILAIKLLKV